MCMSLGPNVDRRDTRDVLLADASLASRCGLIEHFHIREGPATSGARNSQGALTCGYVMTVCHCTVPVPGELTSRGTKTKPFDYTRRPSGLTW